MSLEELGDHKVSSSMGDRCALKTDKSVECEWSSGSRGKVEDEQRNCCGICLGDEDAGGVGGVSRGCIDSCDHYFCFVCIMEWAKVESKCPLCKRRFSTIRRPPKPPIFPSHRLITVPLRNQAYDSSGNVISETRDPYAEARCSVCLGSDDDSYLLLCDLCDSSSHTYCVGLGATVPEGDWFCHECSLMRDEHNKPEIDQDSQQPVSVFDTVTQPRAESLERIVNGARHNSDVSNSWRQGFGEAVSNSTTQEHNTKLAARTLSQCRSVHERIRALRDNWNSIRNGSLNFTIDNGYAVGDCVNSGLTNSVFPLSHNMGAGSTSSIPDICINSGQSSSIQNREISIGKGDSYDTPKAWKMLRIAKKIEKRSPHTQSPASVRKGSNLARCNGKNSESMWKPQMLERQNHPRSSSGSDNVFLDSQSRRGRSSNGNAPNYHERSTSTVSNEPAKPETQSQQSSQKGPSVPEEKRSVSSNALGNCDAKTEIQSLVKLNLKLLTRAKRIEVDVFKQVARSATHSILVACGLEYPKPGVHEFSSSVCSHKETDVQFRRSTLMPSSCSECFNAFAKDVVNSILLDKTRE